MNRRKFLKIAGGTGMVLGATSAGFAMNQSPASAIQPWQQAGSLYSDPMRNALSYAILAPSAHNRQPWMVDLTSGTEAMLVCDLDRRNPATDPFDRQTTIGLGCFIEAFCLAAAQQGYKAKLSYFPQGRPNATALDRHPIAHLSLTQGSDVQPDPLFHQILNRHTNRNPYDLNRDIDEDILHRLRKTASRQVYLDATNAPSLVKYLRKLTRDALFTELSTPEANRESISLTRIGQTEIDANPDGISLSGPVTEAMAMTGILTRSAFSDPTSYVSKAAIDTAEKAAMSGMGYVWIQSYGNNRRAQIDSGRTYMRLALQAAAEGLSIHPMSQALQEYPAMKKHYAELHGVLTYSPRKRLQLLARLGYDNGASPSPRWPLENRIRSV